MSKPKTIDVFFKKIDISHSEFKTLVSIKKNLMQNVLL